MTTMQLNRRAFLQRHRARRRRHDGRHLYRSADRRVRPGPAGSGGRLRSQRLRQDHRRQRRHDHVEEPRDRAGDQDVAADAHCRGARSAVGGRAHRAGRSRSVEVRPAECRRQHGDAEQLRSAAPRRRGRAADARGGRARRRGTSPSPNATRRRRRCTTVRATAR